MNVSNEDPLARLFVSEQNLVDKELLAETIIPYATIYLDGDVPQIAFTEQGEGLSIREQILVHLLARKAIRLHNPELLESEGISPKDLEAATSISGGTLRPALRKLVDDKLATQDKEGGYFVLNRALRTVNSQLKRQ
jgi:DNA-binding transcriptional ArsR family regulator